MAFYSYPSYQTPFYPQPVPDQLAQLRQNQVQQMAQNQPQQFQPTGSGILWVQGEEGAKAFLTAPGASVMLMDSEKNTFYIKSSDQSGMPLPLRIFDYTERSANKQPVQDAQQPGVEYVTRAEFDALAARMEALTAKEPPKKRTAIKEDAENG